jgi:porin
MANGQLPDDHTVYSSAIHARITDKNPVHELVFVTLQSEMDHRIPDCKYGLPHPTILYIVKACHAANSTFHQQAATAGGIDGAFVTTGKFSFCLCTLLMASMGALAIGGEAARSAEGKPQNATGKVSTERPGSKGLGGPGTVEAQIREDRYVRAQESRMPWLDAIFDPLETAKDRLNENTGIDLGLDYQFVYQSATQSISDIDDGAAGSVRLFGNIALVNRKGVNTGKLVFIVENRHKLWTDIDAQNLGFETGYFGIPAPTYSNAGSILTVLNWNQALFDDRLGITVGRIDPTDYLDVVGHANMRTAFLNLENISDTSIFLPDPGMGAVAGAFLDDNFYALGLLTDANGQLDKVTFFDGGSEFMTYVEVGWAASPAHRYTRNVHIGYWHVDAREEAGTEASYGAAMSATYLIDDHWMPFVRAGVSHGNAPLMNAYASLGVMYNFTMSQDAAGMAIAWSDPADDGLRQQLLTEMFYRFQLSDNFALTANVQLIRHPALNPDRNFMAIFGFRFRFDV